MGSYTVVDVDELPGEGPGGSVRKLRRALGARAFGFNYFVLPAGAEGHAHDHVADDEEEVYFVAAGSGVMRIDGEEVELRAGRVLRIDPAARRQPVAGDDGLEFLTIGAPLGRLYEPPSWG